MTSMTSSKIALVLIGMFLAQSASAQSVSVKKKSPCTGVEQSLSKQDKMRFAQPIVSQLKKDLPDIKSVEVFGSFQFKNWRILYVNTHVSDEPYLFYDKDPVTHPYVTLWAGAAAYDEEDGIFKWVTKHAKGIPPKLARCFAFHVTHGQ